MYDIITGLFFLWLSWVPMQRTLFGRLSELFLALKLRLNLFLVSNRLDSSLRLRPANR